MNSGFSITTGRAVSLSDLDHSGLAAHPSKRSADSGGALPVGDTPNLGSSGLYRAAPEASGALIAIQDMHGAPPWCVDSNIPGSVQQKWLIAQGDKFVGNIVNQITSSSMWEIGNNAIIITFDEGNTVGPSLVGQLQ
jgi:hypothetical protein